jgi:hypothetical protein
MLSWVTPFHHRLLKRQMSLIEFSSRSPETDAALSFADNNSTTTEQIIIQELLVTARRLGPLGCYASSSDQEYLRTLARQLKDLGAGKSAPGREILSGVFSLIYNDSRGISSGRVFDFLSGRVTQEFITENHYINRLELWNGLCDLSLLAERKIISDFVNNVSFHNITLRVFGQDLYHSNITGGGTWEYLFLGPVRNEQDIPVLLRIFFDPYLIILEQSLPSNYLHLA